MWGGGGNKSIVAGVAVLATLSLLTTFSIFRDRWIGSTKSNDVESVVVSPEKKDLSAHERALLEIIEYQNTETELIDLAVDSALWGSLSERISPLVFEKLLGHISSTAAQEVRLHPLSPGIYSFDASDPLMIGSLMLREIYIGHTNVLKYMVDCGEIELGKIHPSVAEYWFLTFLEKVPDDRLSTPKVLGVSLPYLADKTIQGKVDVSVCGSAVASVRYLIMEHLPGRSLREIIIEGKCTFRGAILYAIEMIKAVRSLHLRNVAHRSISWDSFIWNELDGRMSMVGFSSATFEPSSNEPLDTAKIDIWVSPTELRDNVLVSLFVADVERVFLILSALIHGSELVEAWSSGLNSSREIVPTLEMCEKYQKSHFLYNRCQGSLFEFIRAHDMSSVADDASIFEIIADSLRKDFSLDRVLANLGQSTVRTVKTKLNNLSEHSIESSSAAPDYDFIINTFQSILK